MRQTWKALPSFSTTFTRRYEPNYEWPSYGFLEESAHMQSRHATHASTSPALRSSISLMTCSITCKVVRSASIRTRAVGAVRSKSSNLLWLDAFVSRRETERGGTNASSHKRFDDFERTAPTAL